MADGSDILHPRARMAVELEHPEWIKLEPAAPPLATLVLWLLMGAALGVFWRELFGIVARLFA